MTVKRATVRNRCVSVALHYQEQAHIAQHHWRTLAHQKILHTALLHKCFRGYRKANNVDISFFSSKLAISFVCTLLTSLLLLKRFVEVLIIQQLLLHRDVKSLCFCDIVRKFSSSRPKREKKQQLCFFQTQALQF